MTDSFSGFTPQALQFLVDLAGNNERTWFQARKVEYERLLKEPLEALCVALGERFEQRGIPLTSDPRRSPFRIYRDVRFSRDKSPYKTHVAANFPWSDPAPVGQAEAHGGVGGYFSFSPAESYIGGGMWHPERERLAAFRRIVDQDPERVMAAVADPAFVDAFKNVHGDSLTRVPQGFDKDHPRAELLKLKDVVFGLELSEEDVFSPGLPDVIAEAFSASVPVLRLLASLGGE